MSKKRKAVPQFKSGADQSLARRESEVVRLGPEREKTEMALQQYF